MLAENLLVGINTEEERISYLCKFRGIERPKNIQNYQEIIDKFFQKDSIPIYSQYHIDHDDNWVKCFASNMIIGEHIDPLILEPFIARYIIAINRIGIKTSGSCDGWHTHSENNLKIVFRERYSRIWHELICKRLGFELKWCSSGYTSVLELPKTDTAKIQKYIYLNKCAEYLENNQKELIELKKHLIKKLKNKEKNNRSDNEIRTMFNEAIKGF